METQTVAPQWCSRQASQRCFEHKLLNGDYTGDCSFGSRTKEGNLPLSNLRSTQNTSRFSRSYRQSEEVDEQKENRLESLHSNDVETKLWWIISGGSSSLHLAYCIPQFGRRSFVNTKPNLGDTGILLIVGSQLALFRARKCKSSSLR